MTIDPQQTIRLFSWLDRIPRWKAWVGVGLSLAVFALGDYLTGPDYSFSLFYYLNVGLATLLLGFGPGVILSIFATTFWTVIMVLDQRIPSAWALYWGIGSHFLTFTLLAFVFDQLHALVRELERHSFHDALTGLPNRRYLVDFLGRILREAERSPAPLTVAYFDVDNFKTINDTKGHAAGDKALRSLSKLVQGRIRPGDLVARLGGDEFLLVLPGTAPPLAGEVLHRIFADLPLGLSIGAVCFQVPPSEGDAVLASADKAMYEVKKTGKGRLSLMVV